MIRRFRPVLFAATVAVAALGVTACSTTESTTPTATAEQTSAAPTAQTSAPETSAAETSAAETSAAESSAPETSAASSDDADAGSGLVDCNAGSTKVKCLAGITMPDGAEAKDLMAAEGSATFTLTKPDAATAVAHIKKSAQDAGYEITADSAAAITFKGKGCEGAVLSLGDAGTQIAFSCS